MELKFAWIANRRIRAVGFNRTLVELKCAEGFSLHAGIVCFNRTLVELKYIKSVEVESL